MDKKLQNRHTSPLDAQRGLTPGSPAVHRGLEVLAPEVTVSALLDRVELGAWGLFGGEPGRCAAILVRRAGETAFREFTAAFGTVSPSKFVGVVLHAGDVVRIESAGGGGYGNPQEREPELILRDVRAGLVSAGEAERSYGVVLMPADDAVDETRTATVRAGRT
jgi:N-methylhydantoinase B